jgi:hypothetical protein
VDIWGKSDEKIFIGVAKKYFGVGRWKLLDVD